MGQIQESSQHFPQILNVIDSFKQRRLSEVEQTEYAKFAIMSRYLYRKALPGSFKDMTNMAQKMLSVRRQEDNGDTAWQVYNRVQENIVRGIEGITRPVKGYDDSIRVNRLLWKGTELALTSNQDRFKNELGNLLLKNKKKKAVVTV